MRQDLRLRENLPAQIDLTYRHRNATVTLSQLYRAGVRATHFVAAGEICIPLLKLYRYGVYFESFAVLAF